MSNNRLKNKFLKVLYDTFHQNYNQLSKIKNVRPIGMSFEELCDSLKITISKLEELAMILLKEGEIKKFELKDNSGFYISEKGMDSYSDKKYKRVIYKRIKETTLFWTTIIFGSISIGLAISNTILLNKNKEINVKYNKLEIKYNNLKTDFEKNMKEEITEKDSLK